MADESSQIGQDEIEALLSQAAAGKTEPAAPAAPEPAAATAAPTPPAGSGNSGGAPAMSHETDMDILLDKATAALASIDNPSGASPPGIVPFSLQNFDSPAQSPSDRATLDLLSEVELDLKIELGRTNMYLEEVLNLREGSVVALDKLAGDPVEIFANGRLIACGEVLILNDNFCVRIAELIAGDGAA